MLYLYTHYRVEIRSEKIYDFQNRLPSVLSVTRILPPLGLPGRDISRSSRRRQQTNGSKLIFSEKIGVMKVFCLREFDSGTQKVHLKLSVKGTKGESTGKWGETGPGTRDVLDFPLT